MPRRIVINPHLTTEELYRRYRNAQETTEKSHYHIIWLLAQGKTTKEVAEITGYSQNWIYELVWGYNRLGADSLGDKRKLNAGGKPLLNDEQQALLWQALQEPPPDGGLWTGPKVADWMSQLLEKKVLPQRVWEYLKSLEYVRRRPRPAHVESDDLEQQQWKKKLRRPSHKSNESIQEHE
jgi:transposase